MHRRKFILALLKGDRNPNDKLLYKKELYKPWILIPVSSKSVEKWRQWWPLKYLEIDFNGSGHIVGFVTSHSLIKYA